MSYFIPFIYGTAAFYAYKFFPAITIIISLLFIALWLFYGNTAKDTQQKINPNKIIKFKIIQGLLIIIIALSGFFYANARHITETPTEEIAGETLLIKGALDSEPIYRDRFVTYSQIVNITNASHENGSPVSIKKLRLTTDYPLEVNRLYSIKVRMRHYYMNPGSFQIMPSGRAIEITDHGDVDVSSFHKARQEARARLNNYIKNNFSEESAPFIMAIVTGERRAFPKEIRDAFSSTGLAHILSISGAHFGLLFAILFALFRLMIKTLPYALLARLTLYLTPSQIAAVLCIPFMAGYLTISDMSVPSVRAFIMINLFLIGLLIGRKGFWLNTLLFAAVVIILMHPNAIVDISFQLSFIAVLCIGMAVEQQSNRAAERLEQFKRFKLLPIALLLYCSTALKISIAATIGTAMLVAYYFNYFSVISPITNLIITPFIGFIILPLALMASFVFLASNIFPFQSLIDAAASFAISAIMYIAEWEFVDIEIPAFPLILLVMFYLGILVYLITEQKSRRTEEQKSGRSEVFLKDNLFHNLTSALPSFRAKGLLLSATIAVMPIVLYTGIKIFEPKRMSITFLDVRQGNSAVVELPDKKVLVIDTGRSGFQTANFLRYRGLKKIDALVLSHGSLDHAGGLNRILNDFNVREIWDNSRLIYSDGLLNGIVHRRLERGDTTGGRGYRITVLHPYDGFYTMFSGSDENNDSLVIRIDGIINSFLFTGDIEQEAQEDLWHLGGHLKSNVIKVPHHGSRTSASEIFFNEVSPDIAVISAGRKNRHGHPHNEMLQLLEGAKVLRTDIDGAIGIREMKDGSLIVRTWNEFRIAEAKSLRDELANLQKLFLSW
jgi:competence protein ComEC